MSLHFRFNFLRRFVVGALILAATQSPAVNAAEDVTESRIPPLDLVWHAGAIGVFDEESHDTFASVEGRWRHSWRGLRPWGGFTVSDAGVWFAGAGLIYDIHVAERVVVTLGSGPFYYTHDRQDDDLGLSLEFYSFIEASWVRRDETRFGVRFGHLSNAGLGRRNPGTETLSFVVSVPLDRIVPHR
jgi:Lipid A 3-O-deacylase (PagL).